MSHSLNDQEMTMGKINMVYIKICPNNATTDAKGVNRLHFLGLGVRDAQHAICKAED